MVALPLVAGRSVSPVDSDKALGFLSRGSLGQVLSRDSLDSLGQGVVQWSQMSGDHR